MRRAARLTPLALLLVFVAGCVYFPTVADTGSPRLMPKNGRLVRTDTGAVCYFELDNLGMYGDTLLGAESQLARRVQVESPEGAPLRLLEIPGLSRFDFHPAGPRITLSELTAPLVPGDGVIVTLFFAKSGRIGVISKVE